MASEREIAFARYWEGKKGRKLTVDVVRDAYLAGWSDKPLAPPSADNSTLESRESAHVGPAPAPGAEATAGTDAGGTAAFNGSLIAALKENWLKFRQWFNANPLTPFRYLAYATVGATAYQLINVFHGEKFDGGMLFDAVYWTACAMLAVHIGWVKR